MENRIRQHIEAIFASAPDTAKARELREEMIVNVIERYHDYIAEGKSPETAYNCAITGIGDVSELIASLGGDQKAQNTPPTNSVCPPPYTPAPPMPAKKGLSTGATVAIVICATILLLVIIGGIIAVRITGNLFSGDGLLSNIFNSVSSGMGNGSVYGSFSFDDDNGFDNAYYESGEYAVAANGITKLEVFWVSGSVTVLPAPEGQTEISFKETSNSSITDTNALRFAVNNDSLVIRFCTSNAWQDIDWTNLFNSALSKKLTVYIPLDMLPFEELSVNSVANTLLLDGVSASNIRVEMVSGEATVKNVAVSELELNTVSGALNVDAVAAALCNANSVSGDINLTSCAIGELRCSGISGRINALGAFDKTELETVSGAMTLELTDTPTSVEVDSTSGSVTLRGFDRFGFTARYNSASGDFSSTFSLNISGNTYIFGDGAVDVDIDTVSGDLYFK